MRRLVFAVALLVAAIVSSVALAASELHLPGQYYAGQTDSGSSYSSSWRTEISHTTSSTDRSVTLIDNVSYSWHDTERGTGADIDAHWSSATGKKGYCILHQGGYVGCSVFDF